MSKNSDLVQTARELGQKYEHDFRGCAQCLLAAVTDTLEIRRDEMFKSATALAGGVGLRGDGCCGAYLGGVMMIGDAIGRTRDNLADPDGERFTAYKLAAEFHKMFIQEYGTIICRDIQTKELGRPFFISDPDEMKKFDEAGGHSHKCPEIVGKASGWVMDLLVNNDLVEAPRG
jgi:C_GCAxxG_C_C family probable redox protein